jgi:hypothetical protein
MRPHWKTCAVLLAGLAGLTAHPARAQLLMRYLPQSVPGYQLDPALAVLQNGGPDYRSQGVRVGDFIVRPGIAETFGFNDNPLGLVDARSSLVIGSAGSLSLNSDWSRDSIGASLSVDDLRYTALPIGDQTSYSAFTGGRIDIGRDSLDISGGRVSTYIAPTDVLSQGLAAPIPFSSNDLRIAYTAPFSRLTLTPSLDFTTYQFGQPASGADGVDEGMLDNDQIAAGIAASYELSPGHNLVAAFLQTNAYLLHRPAGNTLSHYDDNLLLAGLDYDTYAAFRYDVLLGYEIRSFSGGVQSDRQTPAAEISVTWRPSMLTTINASGIRHLSDASAFVANNLVYNEGKVDLYHELYRNVILNGDVDFQSTNGSPADGGNRTSLSAGAGATYLLNRQVRLDLAYQFSQGSGFTSFAGILGANTTQAANRNFQSNLLQWTVHFGF